MHPRLNTVLSLLCATALMGPGLAHADEGMWTFDNFPMAKVNAKYHTDIDQAWLDHVRGSAARLSVGCSSSVVSAYGLVLTNHHCVRDCAQQISDAQHDYVANGFIAASGAEEKLCPGLEADILDQITDVTNQVLGATAGKTGQEFIHARNATIAGIEAAACKGREDKYQCQVVNLYEGGQYKLYTYRKFTDVRLVFAPEAQTAFFGGDPDNFNFPRYDLDCGFLRLYENGKPAQTPTHLTWNAAAPTAGEAVFVAGNPGRTERLFTADQLLTLRTIGLPTSLALLSELRGRLIRFGEESPEHARISNDELFGIENSFKALRGQDEALLGTDLIEQKRKADAALRRRVQADPALRAEIGDPWRDVARIQTEVAALSLPYSLTERLAPQVSTLYQYAVDLVRGAEERSKPNQDRLPEFSDSRLPIMEKLLFDDQPVYPELEQLNLEFMLSKLREYLTADAPETAIFLGKQSPEELSHTLAASRLGDPALRKQLWDGGLAAIRTSQDPMIQFVLRTDEAARGIRKEYEGKVTGPSEAAAQRIARARFAVYGTSIYPDATFTLRLSYGAIDGWTLNGQTVPPFTEFAGLYRRATGEFPFALAPRWIAAQGKLNQSTVFDLATTNDIIGGNSGSPLIDAKGEVIGAIFDGNIYSLGGDFAFDPALNRSVAVSTAAITEALGTVYGDTRLVHELTGS
jgi:hypothetical protein